MMKSSRFCTARSSADQQTEKPRKPFWFELGAAIEILYYIIRRLHLLQDSRRALHTFPVEDINGFIGKSVREQRKKMNMTQEQLAESAGVSFDVVKRVENGMGTKCDLLFQIAVGLGVPVECLYPIQMCNRDSRIENAISLLKGLQSKPHFT